MKQIKISALMFFALAYLSLILMFLFENELEELEFPFIFIIWGIGIINVALNIYYGLKLNLKNWILISLIISGLTWAFPPLLFTVFGIPFLIVYLLLGIYVHRQKPADLIVG